MAERSMAEAWLSMAETNSQYWQNNVIREVKIIPGEFHDQGTLNG
jgi:hypothetical protein